MGCDTGKGRIALCLFNFNPRTHVGCDRPSRIAAARRSNFNPRTHVGCDVLRLACSYKAQSFQSTHPRGVRLNLAGDIFRISGISIHAPTWGATDLNVTVAIRIRISIHAPTWGATPTAFANLETLIFQSTHPRGVRPAWQSDCKPMSDFNPRTHVGCDLLPL